MQGSSVEPEPQRRRERHLTETSTQTVDKTDQAFECADVNPVQKVAEYLQSGGFSSRSRTSSSCTDLSDPHGEGSEKGDNVMKTPQSKGVGRGERKRTPSTLSRRESIERKSPKSPGEIQDILKTYSTIISKSQHKQKARNNEEMNSPTSQRPNVAETSTWVGGKLVPRRLSTQSLPEELLRNKAGQVPSSPSVGSRSEVSAKDLVPKKLETQASFSGDKAGTSFKGNLNQPSNPMREDIDHGGKVLEIDRSEKQSSAVTKSDSLTSVEKADVGVSVGNTKEQVCVVTSESSSMRPTGIENENFTTPVKTTSMQKVSLEETKGAKMIVDINTQKSEKGVPIVHTDRESRHKKKYHRKLLSAHKRNERRKSLDALSPQRTSGSFLAGTQRFASSEKLDSSRDKRDPYRFSSTQSQQSPEVGIRA